MTLLGSKKQGTVDPADPIAVRFALLLAFSRAQGMGMDLTIFAPLYREFLAATKLLRNREGSVWNGGSSGAIDSRAYVELLMRLATWPDEERLRHGSNCTPLQRAAYRRLGATN